MLLRIRDVLVDTELADARFGCLLDQCRGECCVDGESGAPATLEEIIQIEEALPALEQLTGRNYRDAPIAFHDGLDRHLATEPDSGPCIFVMNEGGIAWCAIERLHAQGGIAIPKPLSCHLFPLLLIPMGHGRWLLRLAHRSVCRACDGKGPLVLDFLARPLERAFGAAWLAELRARLQLWREEQVEHHGTEPSGKPKPAQPPQA